ncbi:MAG: 50S ribosomal protein L27 [Candidatus Harrisonbacteria bacterium RIFCSPLOWO2_02_FULL_45_10c]|uniref:Large ribosomal subunit protein bL27 n=1 Tax=Candidatus Harrisonbacteria bacterium RIFCSPLOWO2_02_FULL_45_10c TaxID=1798410 RepID=A0A1G1ZR77_9BACT|nr:MAG: 50S ribosomal protein L27 [Candidatus Harrisonbacteria bacterium RIFCSPLOWO2_02_FULL_45_10c]
MAHTKSVGAAHNARESESKRLGIKKANGEVISVGQIIVRQRGTKYVPGLNVRRADDDTLFALKNGKVAYKSSKKIRFDGSRRYITVVSVR